MPITFEAPNYEMGNSGSITSSLSSVLTTLDQALQALQPAPNATTVQFNDTILLNDGSTVDNTNISPTEILISDGVYNGRIHKDLMSFDNNVDGLAIHIEQSAPRIYLTDGTITNIIDKNGYTTRNTTANATHYLDFSDSSATGTGAIQKTAGLSCNPNTNTITATTFSGNATSSTTASTSTNSNISLVSTGVYYPTFSTNTSGSQALLASSGLSFNATSSTLTTTTFSGALTGTATNATNVVLTSDNTSGTYYLPFVKTSGGGNKPLFIDDTTGPLSYNPSTATLTTTAFNITGTPATASVASTFGQVGLVKLQTLPIAITGSASAVNFNLANIFTTAYKNYRIELSPTTQVSFIAYPNYSLQAFLGTGSPPTTASLYGYEMTSSNTVLVAPVYTLGATISSSPLIFAVASLTNKQVVFEIQNVGFAYTTSQNIYLSCKSFYGNPGVSGVRDANIASAGSNGTTITGLTIQQSSIGVGNNFTLQAIIYGYNQL